MQYYLGVDIGTTSAKAVALSPEGEILKRQSVTYAMRHTAADRSEQDPDEITRAVAQCINDVIAALQPSFPDMVSFSAAMHSLLVVDGEGLPLTPLMIWADNRAAAVADALRNSEEGVAFYRATGVPIHAMTPLCKLIWLRQHEPRLFMSGCRFIGIKEYVFSKLFGEYLVDSAIASATGLLNLGTLQWDEDILRYLSVDCSKLARVVPPRHILSYDAGKGDNSTPLLIRPGTPIVIGASDGALANLATGAIGDHIMAVTIGTSGAVRMISQRAELDPAMRTFCYHVQGDYYVRGGPTNNGAIVLQWLKENLLCTGESYDELMVLAGTVLPGSDGLLFIPYILGERAPVWNAKARGIYFGLDIRHGKAHLVRAAMEGVIYGLYNIGNILSEGKAIREVHATGGFARSPLWLQMLADVFMVRVLAFGHEEGSAIGAVVVGMEALGQLPAFRKKVLAVYEPDEVAHGVYHERVGKFGRIYEKLKDEFNVQPVESVHLF
jgi:gluconokinase